MLARAIAGFVLVPLMGFTGVTLGNPIAWILADAFLIPAYFHVRKVMEKRLAWDKAQAEGTGKEEREDRRVSPVKSKLKFI